MTTIVYHHNVIAVDSRETCGDLIVSDSANKIECHEGIYFVMCGAVCDGPELVKGYFDRSHSLKVNVNGLIIDNNIIYLAGIDDKDGFWKQDITGQSRAMGSGQDHALTALDLGCDSVKAVKMAIKRDTGSGGRVRTLKCQ